MPTYDYQCANGHQFELFQRITEKPKAKCPVCGANARRMISGGAGLIFKGSGFYITDYGKDGKGPRKEAEATPDAAPTKSEPAADAKPAAPADKKPEPESKPSKKRGKATS